MKAIIKLDLSYPNRLFKTKEEWFPCVSIATHYEYSNSFLTRKHHQFFYDFTLECKEDEGENND